MEARASRAAMERVGQQAAPRPGSLTHQDKAVHDVLTELQASGTCYFQEQAASCFLNLKNWISEKKSYWCWAASHSVNSEVCKQSYRKLEVQPAALALNPCTTSTRHAGAYLLS